MRTPGRTLRILCTLFTSLILLPSAPALLAQSKPAAPPVAAPAAMPSDDTVVATREQVIALLRMSPTLTQLIETDSSILADREYIARVNPSLAQFLTRHPEVVRNPDFFLFSSITSLRSRHVDSLHHRNGNSNVIYVSQPAAPGAPPLPNQQQHGRELLPVIIFIGVVCSFLWLIRILLENRRWSRVFRLQSEVHNKLIDRFASNQELLHYMETESGKRFLEAAPIPVAVDRNQPLPGGIARVLGSLQIGVVLTLLGIGLLGLVHRLTDIADALFIFGIVTLMPGLGFIISAIVTWRISARLGLMPNQPATSSTEPSDPQ